MHDVYIAIGVGFCVVVLELHVGRDRTHDCCACKFAWLIRGSYGASLADRDSSGHRDGSEPVPSPGPISSLVGCGRGEDEAKGNTDGSDPTALSVSA